MGLSQVVRKRANRKVSEQLEGSARAGRYGEMEHCKALAMKERCKNCQSVQMAADYAVETAVNTYSSKTGDLSEDGKEALRNYSRVYDANPCLRVTL